MPKINSLTYNGTKSTDLGVFVTGSGSFNAAEQDIEKVEIAGRNGDLLLPKNRYKNIEVTYPAFIPDAFKENVQSIRNWMRSSKGYTRLEDTYDMEHYRLGLASGVQSFEPANRNDASNFQMTFDCRPERFLKTGETESEVLPVTIEHSGDILEFDSLEETPLTKAELSLSPIQDLHGYSSPWAGGAGANKWDEEWEEGRFSNGVPVSVNDCIRSKNAIPVIAGVTYYGFIGSYASMGTSLYAWYYDEDGTYLNNARIDNRTFTIPTGVSKMRISTYGGNYNVYKNDIAINYPSTVTTYSPYSNICPISGHTEAKVFRTGVNIWDEEWELGSFNNSTGEPIPNIYILRCKNFIPVVGGATYYSLSADNVYFTRLFYDASKNFIVGANIVSKNGTFTAPANAQYMKFRMEDAYGTTYKDDISINYPSTDHDYHPYNGDSFTISLGQTVYGGTLDVVTGQGEITWVSDTYDGSSDENWTASSTYQGSFYLSTGISHAKAVTTGNTISSLAVYNTTFPTQYKKGQYGFDGNGRVILNIWICDSGTSVADFKAKLAANPLQVVYELDTPIELSLTPQEIDTLLGLNVMWGNGEIEIAFSEPFTLTNPTQFEARPLLRVVNPEEDDVIDINGATITFTDDFTGEMFIDCETMDAFAEGINANSYITATDFPVLNSGLNIVRWSGSGELYITPRWWEL